MVVLVAWIAAVAVALLILGIVGYQLLGQAGRLHRAISALRRDVQPRVAELQAGLRDTPSTGRHSAERMHSKR